MKLYEYDALVIGTGAAGYGAADSLYRKGVKNIAVLTEGRLCGTSRNTGSDKQTYYKLSLDGFAADCPGAMAQSIFDGGGTDGDKAYAMAQYSLPAFLRLVDYGVPFPKNAVGGFPGYRTDHDDTRRATSVGPLTSRLMTERLEDKVLNINKTPVLDGRHVIKIVSDGDGVCGALALNTGTNDLEAFSAPCVIAAAGAPACIFADSVYPRSQHGMTGVLLDAGVRLNNFSQWQFGLASTDFRWNLSGSFMQVIPRFVSVGENGTEREFLNDVFPDSAERFTNIFLKGYQWPFAAARRDGSSKIDLAVHEERTQGRRVFLDFTKDPAGFDPALLSDEAREYLAGRGVTGKTPFDRLLALNAKAAAIYEDNGTELSREYLPVAVCAQHCNGGVETDVHGETNLPGLFVIGEAAGNFGLARPGGSALNDTQTGGLLTAERIAERKRERPSPAALERALKSERETLASFTADAASAYDDIPRKISLCAGFLREKEGCAKLLGEIGAHLAEYAPRHRSIASYYRDLDMLRAAKAYLETVLAEMPVTGSRGGALWEENGVTVPEKPEYRSCRTVTENGNIRFVPVKPIPTDDRPFEYFLNRLKL
ncbi:MAG: FAD-binding protein [Clostridia bacterium]|nr:FAD-binding protein [Clostridia bacterium]